MFRCTSKSTPSTARGQELALNWAQRDLCLHFKLKNIRFCNIIILKLNIISKLWFLTCILFPYIFTFQKQSLADKVYIKLQIISLFRCMTCKPEADNIDAEEGRRVCELGPWDPTINDLCWQVMFEGTLVSSKAREMRSEIFFCACVWCGGSQRWRRAAVYLPGWDPLRRKTCSILTGGGYLFTPGIIVVN